MTTVLTPPAAQTAPFSPLRFAFGIGASLLTTVMLVLAFHPYNFWFLAFFALVPMLIAQHRFFPTKWAGLANGLGIGGWLLIFLTAMFEGNPAGQIIQIVVLVIIVAQMFTVPGVRRFHEQTHYRWFVLQGICEWVGFEMVRSFIPPINTHAFIAQTMYTQPWMLQPISIFSLYGLAIVLILNNFALAQVGLMVLDQQWPIQGITPLKSDIAIRWLGVSQTVLGLWIALSFAILAQAPQMTTTIRVAAIQHNYPKSAHKDSPEVQLLRLQALSEQARQAAAQGAQLIVMPELGLGFDPQVEHTAALQALAAETNAYLVIGYGFDDPAGWRNEAVVLTPDGRFLEVYGKNYPTSPGEKTIVTSGVYPVYNTDLGQLATIICNDMHWTSPSRILTQKGAQLIAVPTLELPGLANEQVAQLVLRAVENRVAFVKADVAFASAVITPYGKMVALRNGSPAGEAFALVQEVALGTGDTFYTQWGDWMGWLALGGLLFFMGFQQWSKNNR